MRWTHGTTPNRVICARLRHRPTVDETPYSADEWICGGVSFPDYGRHGRCVPKRDDQGQAVSKGDEGRARRPAVEPFDLPLVRQWLRTLAFVDADSAHGSRRRIFRKAARPAHSHQDEVRSVAENLSGSFGKSPTEDILRRLLALGIVQYVHRIGRVPVDAKAEDIVLDVVAFALWSVVQADALPPDWEEALTLLTSPRMAAHVALARKDGTSEKPASFGLLYSKLAEGPVTHGARNLLEDLSDPRRGGTALASLALAADLPEPDPRQRQKAAAVWLFTAVVGGALGAEGEHLAEVIDRMVAEAWDSIIGESGMHGSSGSHGGTVANDLINDIFHNH